MPLNQLDRADNQQFSIAMVLNHKEKSILLKKNIKINLQKSRWVLTLAPW